MNPQLARAHRILTVSLLALFVTLSGVSTGACATTPPNLMAFPMPREVDGVRIEVNSIIGPWTRPMGVAGVVENLSTEAVERLHLRIDALGYQGATIASATANIEDLGPAEIRRFRANFPLPAPHGLHQVAIGNVHVGR